MATVTVLTAERMLEIEAGSIVSVAVVDGHLILTKFDETEIDSGELLIVKSPDDTLYRIVVSNAGVLSTVAV